ncbi:MAG: aspartate--tRNA ligase [Deltaproteobacteria bacterium]|nr:aspartate--tRNA ligase [Deltaproteobacteria bacterium]
MGRFVEELKRTHGCGALRASDIGAEVVLMGWVASRRDHGGCIFVDLRDRDGTTQVVFRPDVDATSHAAANQLRGEFVIGVRGKVVSRGENVNPKLATGEIEVDAHELEILNRSKPTPFPIEDRLETAEPVRLEHRYLDLRRPLMQKNLRLRSRVNKIVRDHLDGHGFTELETPILTKSTPEGARDYLVPSRVQPGKFYALPQSPQLFKQLFMVAGFDRYYQIARCFRDEDLRADRQPEFTQVDIEMSFVTEDDVIELTSSLVAAIWKEARDVTVPLPIPRLSYADAIARFGVDNPDLRFGLELAEITDLCMTSGFRVFADAAGRPGGAVMALRLPKADLSRSELDTFGEFVKPYGAKGLAWIRVQKDGWQGPIAKFIDAADKAAIASRAGLEEGDLCLFVADARVVAATSLGRLRVHIANKTGIVPKDRWSFVWVERFPMFERDKDDPGRWNAMHHPFTSPLPEDEDKVLGDPGAVRARAYDIVLNGTELGGGSIRIHRREVQSIIFERLGLSQEQARAKFGFLLAALEYGTPPHGGIALGLDRVLAFLCGAESIRDVIAYPKTQKATDLMCEAPSNVDPAQLAELKLKIIA